MTECIWAMVQWVTIRGLTTSMVTTIAMVDLTRDTLLKEAEMRVCETGICLSEERVTTTMTDLNLALKVLTEVIIPTDLQ